MINDVDLKIIKKRVKGKTVAIMGYNVADYMLLFVDDVANIAGFEYDHDAFNDNSKNTKYKNMTIFKRNPINEFDFRDVDVVISVNIQDTLDYPQLCIFDSEVMRVLKPGGINFIMYHSFIMSTTYKSDEGNNDD